MHLTDAIDQQPEYSSVLLEDSCVTLQRTLVLEEDSLEEAFERIPWTRLVFLRCDRQKGGKRILLYRWRAEPGGWTDDM